MKEAAQFLKNEVQGMAKMLLSFTNEIMTSVVTFLNLFYEKAKQDFTEIKHFSTEILSVDRLTIFFTNQARKGLK
jgi:hypothetical protein